MTDREWRAHVHAAYLRERLEVAEAANRVLVGALREAVGRNQAAVRAAYGPVGDSRAEAARSAFPDSRPSDRRISNVCTGTCSKGES